MLRFFGRRLVRGKSPNVVPHRNRRGHKPRLELLEDRTLPTSLGYAFGWSYPYEKAMAVDRAGDVFVPTGNALWKFSPTETSGQSPLWAAKYGALNIPGPSGGGGMDFGYAIAVDTAGNVYVAGSGGSSWTAIEKFDGNTGQLLWVRALGTSNPEDPYGGIGCLITGLALDGAGNVYFTGSFNTADSYTNHLTLTFWSGDAFQPPTSSASSIPAATKQPLNLYQPYPWGSGAFVGEVDSNGRLVWDGGLLNTGPALFRNVYVNANGISTDAAGNVYVAGGFAGTANFDPNGGSYALTSSNASITNYSYPFPPDAFVLKLNPAHRLVWVDDMRAISNAQGSGSAGNSEARGIASDASGNVYLTGGFRGNVYFDPSLGSYEHSVNGSYDAFVEKLDTNGSFQWFAQGHGSPAVGRAIVLDSAGNIYTAGDFTDNPYSPVYFGSTLMHAGQLWETNAYVWQLNATGSTTSVLQMGGDNTFVNGFAIAVDGAGDIFAAGQMLADPNNVPEFTAVPLYLGIGSGVPISVAPYLETNSFGQSFLIKLIQNTPPTADAGGPYGIFEGNSLTLNAGASTDTDGDPLTYSWDVNGDGVFGDATGVGPTLTWAQLQALGITGPGTYSLRVRVDDGHGNVATSPAVPLTIREALPTPIITPPSSGVVGQVLPFSFSVNDPSAVDQAAGFAYVINWGDGSPPQTVAASLGNGSGTSIGHVFTSIGSYPVQVTATDQDGESGATTLGQPTLVNFDALNALPFPDGLSGATLDGYLAQYGISLAAVTPGTRVAVVDNNNLYSGQVAASSSQPNLLTQFGSKNPISFTLNFASPLASFGFTRPELILPAQAGPPWIDPVWHAYAYDAAGNLLSTAGEPLLPTPPIPVGLIPGGTVPPAHFTLNGPGISSVRFDSDSTQVSLLGGVLLDDFVLPPNTTRFLVASAATTTTLTSSAAPSVNGQVITLSAAVRVDSPGAGIPTGNVTFQDGSTILGTATLGANGIAALTTSSLNVGDRTIAASYGGDGNFLSSSASITQTVNPLTATNLQQALSGSSAITLQAGSSTDATNVIAAVDGLPPQSTPVTVTLNLSAGTYTDLIASPPAGVTLVIAGRGAATIVGQSPALTVTTGTVVVNGLSLTTATNSPTILLTLGSLTLRNDVVQESTGFTESAIALTGGTLDLGTPGSPGNNTVNVNGTGEFVHNTTPNLVPASGDAFSRNGTNLSAPYLSFTRASSSLGSSVFGQNVTLTATVSPDTTLLSAPGGSVDFFDATSNADLGTAIVSGGIASLTTSVLEVGIHSILATFSGDNNYLPSLDYETQTVFPATLIVTPDNASRVYGTANPALAATITGFVNGDGPNVVGGAPALTTSATAASAPGNYSITATLGTLTARNYNFSFVNGTLTVNPATPTASAINVAPIAGAPFKGVVATFTNADPFGSPASYSATITWGDGGTSAGAIADVGGGQFTVTGIHTYADPRSDTVSVQIAHTLGYVAPATVTGTASVKSLGNDLTDAQARRIGYWHGATGQALILRFNGGPAATELADWLATSFPNVYGPSAGSHNLTGKTNSQVAAFFQTLYAIHHDNPDVEVLATALNVYATTTVLGGTAGAAAEFRVTDEGLGAVPFNVGTDGAAVGVPNGAELNVYQMLAAADRGAVNGVLYNGTVTLRSQAEDVFEKTTRTQYAQTEEIGFWHRDSGQALIQSFNGGTSATALANWLSATFPNLYGAGAGSHNLTGQTNGQVDAFFQSLWNLGDNNPDVQVLATALNVYATTLSLGGTVAIDYGFLVTNEGLGAVSFNVGSGGAAVGVANGTALNVYEILLAVNQRAVNGVLYGGNADLRDRAGDLFERLNQVEN